MNCSKKNKDKTEEEEEQSPIPILIRPWVFLYNTVPKLRIPYTKYLEVTFVLLTSAFFLTLRAIVDYILITNLHWPEGASYTKEAAASTVSVIHSSLLVPSLGILLLTQPYRPSRRMDECPLWWQNASLALIEFCTGYMLYDAIMIFYDKWDTELHRPNLPLTDQMFLGHHMACTLYMASSLMIGAGHISAMILMFLGEITNPLMNGQIVTRYAIRLSCCSNSFMISLNSYLEFFYAMTYSIFRAIIGPIFAIHLSYDIMISKQGQMNIPWYLTILWLVMCWGVLLGSVGWTFEAVEMMMDGFQVKYGPHYDYGPGYEL